MNYETLSDEQLALLFQDGDELAFDELYYRYEGLLKTRSADDEMRTGLDFDSLFNKHLHLFWKAVEKYDPARGASFKTYLKNYKLRTGTLDVLMYEKYRKKVVDENGESLPKAQPVEQEVLDQVAVEPQPDDSLIVNDIYDYLRSKADIYPIVLDMIIKGYSYEEIGRDLGRQGSPDAIKMWVNRIKNKIAKYVEEYYKEHPITA